MVLDRLFLWIFTFSCVAGTAGIFLQAPSLYDPSRPIDVLLSKIARAQFSAFLDESTFTDLPDDLMELVIESSKNY